MKMSRKIAIIIAIAVIVTLIGTVFAGCKGAVEEAVTEAIEEAVGEELEVEEEAPAEEAVEEEAPAEEAAGGVFRVYIHEPVTLDPANCYESEGIQVIRQVFDGLVKYDPETLETMPALAEKWDISDDGLVYTFYLKKGVNFHSGREVVAGDFVYAWTRLTLADTASYLAYHAAPIVGYDECQEGTADTLTGVKALDDYTLEVTLQYPFADFIKTLGHVCFFPVAKEDVDEYGDLYAENINGNGAFKFVEWKHDQYINLVRNDDYWEENAKLDEVEYKIFADEDTAFLEFKAGNLEYTAIPQGKVKATEEDPDLGDLVIKKPLLAIYYFAMNVQNPPFKDNLALREAVNYAIDRQNICDVINEGVSVPATGFVPPGIPGFQENAMTYTYDPEMAKQKLEEAGYPGGEGLEPIKFGINVGSGHEIVAEAMQADLKDIGIDIEIIGMEWGTALEAFQNGEISFFRLGWIADYPIMDNFLYPLFHSESSDNYSGYVNLEVDKLLVEARKTIDDDEREAKYREVEKIILDDSAFALVYFYGSRRIVQPYVKGFFLSSMEEYDLSKVWLEK